MTLYRISKLNDLLKDHITGDIVNQDITRLTAPGENYGSLMLKVDVTVKNKNKEEIVHAVAKCVPPNKKMQEIFHTQTTFKNEIGWYKEAIPTMLEFQRTQGVEDVADFFMNIYDARQSLDPNNPNVDDDAVILCENLAVKGFKNVNRRVGFNLIQTREIIKKLAAFHAMTLALKLQNPELFNNKIKRYVRPADMGGHKFELFENILKALKENRETVSLVPRLEKTMKQILSEPRGGNRGREPWATVIHSDFWVNNIMLNDETPPKVIILDLQTCLYASPMADLLFFLATSIETAVVEKNFDSLIKLYYEEFIDNLRLLNTDTTEFSYVDFENELILEAPKELIHSMFFIAMIMAEKGEVTDATSTEFEPELALKKMFSNITEKHEEKYVYIAKQYARKNWI